MSAKVPSHLVGLVTEPYVFAFHVNFVHGHAATSRGLLGDACASDSSTNHAGGIAVIIIQATFFSAAGRSATGAALDHTCVRARTRRAGHSHPTDRRGTRGETQPLTERAGWVESYSMRRSFTTSPIISFEGFTLQILIHAITLIN